ncbi:MAG: metallophosphoesterase [bacterium]
MSKTIRNIQSILLLVIAFAIFPNFLLSDQSIESEVKTTICFISDTQTPLWTERLFLKSEKNEAATDALFNDIIKQKPTSLFILGDMVSKSSNNSSWKTLDKSIELLKKSSILVNAIPGNHEYMSSDKKAMRNYLQRFPVKTLHGYFQVIDSIAILMLNSNFDNLSKIEIKQQNDWYARTMDSLNQTASIKLIIVACHHSPFTNSKIVSSSKKVQQFFVPKYLECNKAKLFISGHSHNLEQFKYKGKDFLVIGGGGGPMQPLKKPANQSWKDEISSDIKPRFFYIMIEKNHGKITVIARGCKIPSIQLNEINILSL